MAKRETHKFGFERRADERRQEKKSIERRVEHMIEVHLSEHHNQAMSISDDSFNNGIEALHQELLIRFKRFGQFRIARNHLSRFINAGNEAGKWNLPVPPPIHRARRDRVIRTKRWYKNVKTLNSCRQMWLTSLSESNPSTTNLSGDRLLGLCLTSAALFGGLCVPEAFSALQKELLESEKPLRKIDGQLYFDLIFEQSSQAHNVIVDGESKTQRRWYPDSLTLAFIYKYLSTAQLEPVTDTNTAWFRIKATLRTINKDTTIGIRTLQNFCFAVAGVLENTPKVTLNQALFNYLIGQVPSASLPSDFYVAINKGTFQKSNILYEYSAKTEAAFLPQKSSNQTHNEYLTHSLALIRNALAIHNRDKKRRTALQAINKLQEIIDQKSYIPLRLLVQWLISLFFEKKQKRVSSALRYFYSFGAAWLTHTNEVDIHKFEGDDFEALYQDMVDQELSQHKQAEMARMLTRFHRYLTDFHEFPLISNYLEKSTASGKTFVQAGFIPDSAFDLFLATIDNLKCSPLLIQNIRCLFIVAYRTGLRRLELLRLRINDIEDSEEGWLFVMSNLYGYDKTSSARRKLPLNALLTENEAAEFKQFLSMKQKLYKGKNVQLFSSPQTPYQPLDAAQVSALFSDSMSKILGVRTRFHHLRHTALSRLQLILEDERLFLKKYCSYTEAEINNIHTALCGPNIQVKHDLYWTISSFAGHISPRQTFASYLHFTDIIVAKRLAEGGPEIPRQAFEKASGLSTNMLTRFSKEITVKNDWSTAIRPLLMKKLKGYTEIMDVRSQILTKPSGEKGPITQKELRKTKASPELCLALLKDAENMASIEQLVLKYDLEEALIRKWIYNAKLLSLKNTQRGAPRLFSKYKAPTPSRELLAPCAPQTNIELIEADRAINRLRDLYPRHKEEIAWCINYALSNTHSNDRSVTFINHNDAKKYLYIVEQAFSRKNIDLGLFTLNSESTAGQHSYWRGVSMHRDIAIREKTVKNKSKFPNGKLSVSLFKSHVPTQESSASRKRAGSNVLIYVFHLLGIMTL